MKDTTPTKPTANANDESPKDNVTPVKCFFSSMISGGFAFAVYLLFNSIVQTYAHKPVIGTNPLVVNITSAVRTLVMGTMAMATGVFALVAVGLLLLGIQLSFQKTQQD